MTLLTIHLIPDEVLKKTAEPVTVFDRELGSFLDRMFATMYDARGIGLASPQVGVLKRVVTIDLSHDETEKLELINPEIVAFEGSMPSEEGCLSIPDYRDTIKRHAWVKVKAFNRHGEPFEIEGEELLAACLQHEIDHLNGVLFTDHLSRLKRELYRRWLRKFIAEQAE